LVKFSQTSWLIICPSFGYFENLILNDFMKIAILLSGGVDSSVALRLLQKKDTTLPLSI